MSAEIIYTSDNRTVLRVGVGWDIREQRIIFHAAGGSRELYFPYPDGGKQDLYMDTDEWKDYFITPITNSNIGSVYVERQSRVVILGVAGDWKTEATHDLSYEIRANAYTRPTFTASYSAIDLMSNFYIANKSSVKGSISNISTKYGAGVKSTQFTVGSNSYGDPYESGKLNSGSYALIATVTDTRGISTSQNLGNITVYDYQTPSVTTASGTNSIKVLRCDKEGNLKDDGTYIYIAARKKYSPLDGSNKCTLNLQIKEGISGEWQDEIVLLGESSGDEYVGVFTGVYVDEAKIYPIKLIARDSMAATDSVIITLPSEKVYMEKAGSVNSIAFGGHVTENNAFEVYQDAYYRGGIYIDDVEGRTRYKITIGTDGILRAEQINTTYTLRRR